MEISHHTHREESDMKMKVEAGVIQPQAKEHNSHQKLKEARDEWSHEASKKNRPADILILGSGF